MYHFKRLLMPFGLFTSLSLVAVANNDPTYSGTRPMSDGASRRDNANQSRMPNTDANSSLSEELRQSQAEDSWNKKKINKKGQAAKAALEKRGSGTGVKGTGDVSVGSGEN